MWGRAHSVTHLWVSDRTSHVSLHLPHVCACMDSIDHIRTWYKGCAHEDGFVGSLGLLYAIASETLSSKHQYSAPILFCHFYVKNVIFCALFSHLWCHLMKSFDFSPVVLAVAVFYWNNKWLKTYHRTRSFSNNPSLFREKIIISTRPIYSLKVFLQWLLFGLWYYDVIINLLLALHCHTLTGIFLCSSCLSPLFWFLGILCHSLYCIHSFTFCIIMHAHK